MHSKDNQDQPRKFLIDSKDLEKFLNRSGSPTQPAYVENVLQRGFFTINKLKTHIADRKQF